MRRRIFLYGQYKERCPEVIELEADTVAEAINGLCRLKKDLFIPNLVEGTRPVVRVVGFDTVDSLFAKNETRDLHIVPAFNGGKSGFIQIIIGVVLIAAAVFFPATAAFVLGSTTIFGTTVATVALIGASLVLGGLMQTFFPAKLNSGQNADPNNYLGAPGNTAAVGTRIPLLFGTAMAWGQFLSYNVVAVDLNP